MKYLTFLLLLSLLLPFYSLFAQVPVTLWTKTFGGSNIDVGHAVQQTMDGGYIIAGYTRSYGAMSGRNVWLVKTDASGNEEWNNAFGGDNDEEAYSVLQTSDGGYVFTGYTESFGMGLNDVLLIKSDSSGTSQWIRTFGGAQDDEGYCLDHTTDGGFIIAGVTSSSGAGSRDVWLIKTDSTGNEEWNRTLGGFSSDGARSVQQTSDGGYILTGWTLSYGPGFPGNAWLVKTDSAGNVEWDQVFGGDDVDRGYSIQQTADGGYILTGYTSSFGAGLDDMLLIKTDASGNAEWNKTFGGTGRDYGNVVRQTADGGYIITGYTLSFGAGGDDLWLVKTDSAGNEEWNNTYGGSASDVGYDVQQTQDGGYIITGHTLSYGAGLHDVYLIRLAPQTMPIFTITPDSLWFGNVAVGDTALDSVIVHNTGEADLTISSITSSNVLFSISPTAGTIAPDSTAIFHVQFSANDPGSQNGVLLFHNNGLTSPDSVIVHAEVITGITGEGGKIPGQYALYQNYPNPFNPTTTIKFNLPKASQVTLKVFNTLGEEVATLVSERLSAGSYSCEWDSSNLASGIYPYRLQAGDYVETKKMIILK
jgi:hypothetical protein